MDREIFATFPETIADYRDWKDAKAQKEKEAEKPQEEKTARVRLNDKRKMSFKEKREFEQLEKEIAELETEESTDMKSSYVVVPFLLTN